MTVDEIQVEGESGERLVLSLEEWKALELDTKVGYLRDSQVTFLADGSEVPVEQALSHLRGRR